MPVTQICPYLRIQYKYIGYNKPHPLYCPQFLQCQHKIGQISCPVEGGARILEVRLYPITSDVVNISLHYRRLRQREATTYHIQLCVAVLCMLLVFIAGIEQTEHYAACVAVSALLHYFTLAAILWMSAEAILMFKKLAFVFKKTTNRFLAVVSLLCWCKLRYYSYTCCNNYT